MDDIIQYLKDCFKPPYIEKSLTDREMIALRNLILIANERVWLTSNYPKRPGAHMDYEEDLSAEREELLNSSVQVVKELMNRRNNG